MPVAVYPVPPRPGRASRRRPGLMYEVQVDGGDPSPSARRDPVVGVGVLAIVVIVLIVLIVLAVRVPGELPSAVADPSPTEPPVASLPVSSALDLSGYGSIEFGQGYWGFRRAVCPDLCPANRGLSEVARDVDRRCELEVWSGIEPNIRATTWVWLRSDEVVAIGVYDSWGARAVSTWPGVALGDPFGPGSPVVWAWAWDPAAAVPVARHVTDDRVTTLADTDSDGLLDYATVATPAGEACEIPADRLGPLAWPEPTSIIDDASIFGLTVGMSAEQAMSIPAWRWDGVTIAGCRRLVSLDSDARAFVRDQVVGLSADAIAGGVAVGQPIDVARQHLREIRIDGPDAATLDSDDHLVIRGLDTEGRPVTLSARPFPQFVARLDWPVYVPGTAQVSALTLGEDCSDAAG